MENTGADCWGVCGGGVGWGGVRRCPRGMDTHSGQSFGQFSGVEL